MDFIDKEVERRILEEAKKRSKKKLYTIVVYGVRRVGKRDPSLSS